GIHTPHQNFALAATASNRAMRKENKRAQPSAFHGPTSVRSSHLHPNGSVAPDQVCFPRTAQVPPISPYRLGERNHWACSGLSAPFVRKRQDWPETETPGSAAPS